MVNGRPSLGAEGLDEVWALVRVRLEKQGVHSRGRVRLPALGTPARLALTSLLGRPPAKSIDLVALERALVALELGTDLAGAMAALGHPVSHEPARRREERATGRAARDAARREAATWPEPWAGAWIDEVVRAGILRGFNLEGASGFMASVRVVLDELGPAVATADRTVEASASRSRTDLAAQVLGSSHALDAGTRLEAALTRALAWSIDPGDTPEGDPPVALPIKQADNGATERHGDGEGSIEQLDPRDLWDRAGFHLDLTSGPVLTWALPLRAGSALAELSASATAVGVPLHLSRFALRDHPVSVEAGVEILVVENPRIVEAAAQSGTERSVVATNGNPSAAVRLLLDQLLACGATLRYHGDFDAAGMAICARLAALGLVPWRMDAADYRAAVASADQAGVELPVDDAPAGPTAWDPELQAEYNAQRRIVHEERLLPRLLEP